MVAFGAALFLSFGSAAAAPPARYGGSLGLEGVRGLDAPSTATPALITASGARFEGLYARTDAGCVPQLAEAPIEWSADRARIRLRPKLALHDGRVLGASEVVAWLERALRSGSPAAHLAPFVRGGLDWLEGRGDGPAVRIVDERTLELGLIAPLPELECLLARPEMRVFARDSRGVPVGTGPFARHPRDPSRLVAFTAHREGRPFLDELVLGGGSPSTARLGFGAGRSCPNVRELLVLAVGRLSPPVEAWQRVASAIDRQRLVDRFLPPGSAPAHGLLEEGMPVPAPSGPANGTLHAVLVVPEDLPGGLALAQRAQLELLRAGVSVTLESRTRGAVEALREHGRYELLLDRVAVGTSASPFEALTELLALGTRFGRPDLAPAAWLEAVFRADPDGAERQVSRFAAEVRQTLRIAVLAEIPQGPRLPEGLSGARTTPACGVALADAHWQRDL